MNVTSTIAVSCSIATSSSESFPIDVEKPNQRKRFCFRNAIMVIKISIKLSMHFSTQQKCYLQNHTGRMIVLGKLVNSVSINPVYSTCSQAVEVIYILPRHGHDTWHWNLIVIWIAQASEKVSNGKYLLRVAQAVRYLVRPGWPI